MFTFLSTTAVSGLLVQCSLIFSRVHCVVLCLYVLGGLYGEGHCKMNPSRALRCQQVSIWVNDCAWGLPRLAVSPYVMCTFSKPLTHVFTV